MRRYDAATTPERGRQRGAGAVRAVFRAVSCVPGVRVLLSVLAVVGAVLADGHGAAMAQAPDTAQIEKLIATLEDPGEREAFLDDLRALVEANRGAGADSGDVTGHRLAGIVHTLGRIDDRFTYSFAIVTDVIPALVQQPPKQLFYLACPY